MSRRPASAGDAPPVRVLERSEHPISRKNLSDPVLKVLYRLKKTDHVGYLCGGAVRDLMVGGAPKDFDVATDADPEELRRLFRNARIIGRRFRLAHVIFHREIVEVSTFRRTPDPEEQRGGPDDLLITSDNTFGTPREDAFRRDFTINALYYNIDDYSVIDYVGGIDDLDDRLVRVIGDPDLRFCEDPVRMLRACEFAARLDFDIEEETQEAILRQRDELLKAAPPRLTEELLQLLRCGSAEAAMEWMLDLGLLDVLLPEALPMLEADDARVEPFGRLLPLLDARSRSGKRKLSDPVLLGALLLPEIMHRRLSYESRHRCDWMPIDAFRDAVDDVLEHWLERFSLAHYKRSMLRHALEGFHRLCDQKVNAAQRQRIAAKSWFDDALVLFGLLVEATGSGREAYERWQAAKRQKPRRRAAAAEPRRRRRRRR
ncbi:MAG: polynucleotide adenylyltransferase PcnB [Acidobacteriota bacterium]